MERPVMSVVRQLELYRDDSVTAVYNDGCKLLISGCGASFLHVDSTSRHQPCPSRVQQSTEFAISSYQHKLRHVLEFRNKFAERPFLCNSTGLGQKEVRNRPVEVVTWPLCRHCINKTNSGNLILHSVDKNACMELMSNGRTFTVAYWAAVYNKRHCGEPQSSATHHLLTHWCSVKDVPDVWQCPLELLLTAVRDNTECCHSNKQVCSILPRALPTMCRNVHLHNWEKSSRPGDMLKIFWSNHVTYRLMWDKQCVEAYPNQDTVIASCDPEGRYYDMWCSSEASGEVVQYKICYDQLPQCKQFSMVAVIGKMSRLLQTMADWNREMETESVCWKINNEDVPVMPVKQELVKEEVILTEIGRFMAYYSGRIYIAFVDKTILEMYWPQRTDSHCHNNKVLLHDHLQPGYCRLLLSNGQYKTLPVVHNPQPYQRYIEYAVQWGHWAYSEHDRHSDTFIINSGPEYSSVALDEVAKIRQLLQYSSADDKAIAGTSHSSIAATPTHPLLHDGCQQIVTLK